jgi:hypothetical protein
MPRGELFIIGSPGALAFDVTAKARAIRNFSKATSDRRAERKPWRRKLMC